MGGDDDISRFVAKFPSDEQPLDFTDISDEYPRRRIFWTQPPHQTTTSCSDDDDDAVWKLQQKIIRTFCRVFTPRLNGLIQFWAPDVVDDPTALSTSRQPFSLEDLDNPRLVEYRLFSTNYCAVFRKPAFSMVVLDLKAIAHVGVSLVDKALDCGLTCLIWLPVFQVFGHPPPGSFVGVVECCFNPSGYDAIVQVLLRLILAIKSVCLTTYHVQQRLPHEPTLGINRAKVEIEEALKIVCESLHLSLAQVWIDHDTVNRCPSSPSSPFHNLELEEDHSKPPEKFVVKFCGYLTRCEHPDNDYYVKLDYFDTCDVLPLLMDNGLPGKTLQTHDPHFCKDLSKLRQANGLSGILCCRTRCSCLAICLRSTHTGKFVDYVFEFLWPRNRNQIILLESLLLTLKMCLPSFEFAAGAQLGDELRVLDVGNSTPGSEISFFKILQGNRFSQTPKASEGGELHKQKLAKRKFSDLYEVKDHADSDSDPAGYIDPVIEAEYRGMVTTFFPQSSYRLADVKETVEKGFNLEPGTYSMEYQLEGEKFVINTDENLYSCIERWRTFLKTSLTELPFKVHLLPSSECTDQQNTVNNVTGKTDIVSYKQIAANGQGTKIDEQLLRFVEKFPTQQLDSVFDVSPRRWIFWSKTRPEKESSRIRSSSASSCSNLVDDADVWRRWMTHEKIKSAFCRVDTPRVHGLIQFWAPVDETKSSSSSRLHLSSSHQPFSLEDLNDPCICEYRLFSINYQNDSGPHATAFLTHFPEVVQDIRRLDKEGRRSPLVDKALYCDLTCLILLPVFYHPHRSSYSDKSISRSSCVGVVECCIKPAGHLRFLRSLKLALERVGLTTYNVQQRLQYGPSNGLNHARDEIEEALKIVCESLDLNLAQVWIDDDSVNHARCYPSSPSSPLHKEVKEDDTHHQMEQPGMFVVKLCGYLNSAYFVNKDYYDTCDVLRLKFGEGFAGKTLQTREPHFCKDLSSLTGQNGLSGILSFMTKCSGLALCLRSTHTGQGVEYVFEFLWPQNRNQIILLESLLVTLKMCLPSFKFASGAQLGDELQVLNVGCEISPFKILQGNRFSQTSKESREAKELYRPFIHPAKKLSDLHVGDNQTDSESDMDTDSDADPLGCSDSGQTFEDLSEDKLC